MTGAMLIAASALDTFSKTVQVPAHNIANVSTDGFRPLRADLADNPAGSGVHVSAITRDGRVLEHGDESQGAPVRGIPSGTDLSREITGLVIAEKSFRANAETIMAVDDMLGALLDIKG